MDLHPPLTSYPVALLVVVGLLEIINFYCRSDKIAAGIKINLALAGLGAVAAFVSGYLESDQASHSFTVSQDLITAHYNAARITLFLLIPCIALGFISPIAQRGKHWFRGAYYLFLAASIGMVLYTANLGGSLVFEHGAGVKVETK